MKLRSSFDCLLQELLDISDAGIQVFNATSKVT